jgi:hypothetical protein
MAEQYLSPRRNLISVLLTYPQKTTEILSDNQKLVDRNLVQLIELVSRKMEKCGSYDAANYLQRVLDRINLEAE